MAAALNLIEEADPLVEALNGYGPAYRDELAAAILNRLGVTSRSPAEDVALANLAFRAIGEAGKPLRWEPFFFDWFCGEEGRAMAGPRADLYGGEAFDAFRAALKTHAPDRPGRLSDPYFARAEPEELLYDEIEAIWAVIADGDDWSAFEAKVAGIRAAGAAMAL